MRLLLVELPDGLRVFIGFSGESFEEAWRATFLPFEQMPQSATREIPLEYPSFYEAAELIKTISILQGVRPELFRGALSRLLTAAYHIERLPRQN